MKEITQTQIDKIEIEHLNEFICDAYKTLATDKTLDIYSVRVLQKKIEEWEKELEQYNLIPDSEKLKKIENYCKKNPNLLITADKILKIIKEG